VRKVNLINVGEKIEGAIKNNTQDDPKRKKYSLAM
jgi:hypothetical protein